MIAAMKNCKKKKKIAKQNDYTEPKGKEREKGRDFIILVEVRGLLHYFTEPDWSRILYILFAVLSPLALAT